MISVVEAGVLETDPDAHRDCAPDVELLVRLSRAETGLARCRWDASFARRELQLGTTRIALAEARLSADRFALASLRGGADADRVAIDLLEGAVAAGENASLLAKRDARRAADELRPLLARLAPMIEGMARDRQECLVALSPFLRRLYDSLARRKILPLVAGLVGGACDECHASVPPPLVASFMIRSTLPRCPHCHRVLVPVGPSLSTPRLERLV
jgi:hypothetical protein